MSETSRIATEETAAWIEELIRKFARAELRRFVEEAAKKQCELCSYRSPSNGWEHHEPEGLIYEPACEAGWLWSLLEEWEKR